MLMTTPRRGRRRRWASVTHCCGWTRRSVWTANIVTPARFRAIITPEEEGSCFEFTPDSKPFISAVPVGGAVRANLWTSVAPLRRSPAKRPGRPNYRNFLYNQTDMDPGFFFFVLIPLLLLLLLLAIPSFEGLSKILSRCVWWQLLRGVKNPLRFSLHRGAAGKVLVASHDPRASALVKRILLEARCDRHWHYTTAAHYLIEAIIERHDVRFVAELARIVQDTAEPTDRQDRLLEHAISALGTLDRTRAVEILVSLLGTARGGIAARHLGEMEDVRAIGALRTTIETKPHLAALNALVQIGGDSLHDSLLLASRCTDDLVRATSVRYLSQRFGSQSADVLMERLADSSADVRETAVRELLRTASDQPRVVERIVIFLQAEDNARVRGATVLGLEGLPEPVPNTICGSVELVSCLASMFRSEPAESLRHSSGTVLVRFQTRFYEPFVDAIRHDPSKEIRRLAVRALAEFGGPAAADELAAAMSREVVTDEPFALEIALILARSQDNRAIPILVANLRAHKSKRYRYRCAHALDRIGWVATSIDDKVAIALMHTEVAYDGTVSGWKWDSPGDPIPSIRKYLDDADSSVQEAALVVLSELGDISSVSGLLVRIKAGRDFTKPLESILRRRAGEIALDDLKALSNLQRELRFFEQSSFEDQYWTINCSAVRHLASRELKLRKHPARAKRLHVAEA